ncbi:hypothetical protein G3I67_14540 [Orrella sp. NBD-18]|uniref:Uncharacterized protein n=2 Tax=Sheuella amnicola TaxID=2707330 RepID=A0A6B2R5Y3_9BURK|nr:hypothetical protein [Sheuella amnicola]
MTAQVTEILHYQGKSLSLMTNPLTDYFIQADIHADFQGQSTACWRGYANPDFEATRPFLCSSYAYEEHFELVFDPAIKITKIPEGTTFRIQDADMDMRYASTYARDGQLVRVSRSLQSQQSSRVCQPEKMQAMQAIHRAVRRDILSQIFYE